MISTINRRLGRLAGLDMMVVARWKLVVAVGVAVAVLAWALAGDWSGRGGGLLAQTGECSDGTGLDGCGCGADADRAGLQGMQHRRIKFSPQALKWLQQHPASVPVILEDVPVTALAPCFQWTLTSLAQRLHKPVPVKYQAGLEFVYFNEGMPLDAAAQDYGARTPTKPFQEALATLATTLDDLQWKSKGGHHRYVAGPAEMLLDTDLQRDVANLSRIAVSTFRDEEVHTNVWITNDNTTAALHYDTSSNVYAVVEGVKTFSVLPPHFLNRVLFHSSLHPLYRQAAEPWVQIIRAFGQHVQSLTVKRGELLYLPPYWLHRVQSHGWSLAANVWSASADFASSELCFKMPLPFEPSWPKHKLLSKTVTYLSALNRRVNPNRAVLRDRCRVEDAFVHTRCKDGADSHGDSHSVDSLEQGELSRLKYLASCFYTIEDVSVRLLYLHNFVEQTSRLVAGTDALSFLRCRLLPALNARDPE